MLIVAMILIATLAIGCAAPAATPADPPATNETDANETDANETDVNETDANGDEDVDVDTPALDPAEVDVIRVWTDSTVDRDVRMEQAERFNQTIGAENGIIMEYTVHGADWHELIRIAAAGGEAPHIFRPNGQFKPDFVDAGFFRPLTDVPGLESLLERYEGVAQLDSQVAIFGDVYALPFHLTTYKFAINRDIFDDAGIEGIPHSWNDVREMAAIITENGEGQQFGYGIGMQSLWSATTFITRQNQQNVGHFGFDNFELQFDFSSMLPAFEALAGMSEDGSMFPGFEGMDAAAMTAQFVEGRIGMIATASFNAPDLEYAEFNLEIIDIPTFDGGPRNFRQFADATNVFAIGEASFENERILEKVRIVYEFLHSDEVGAELFEAGSVIPFRAEAIALATNIPEGLLVYYTLPEYDFIGMLPSIESMVRLEGMAFNAQLLQIVGLNPPASPAEMLRALDDTMNTAMREQFDDDFLQAYLAPSTWDPTPER